MRIRAALGGILGSVTVLVVGWQAGAAAAHNAQASALSSTSSASDSSGTSAPQAATTPGSTTSSSPASNGGSSSSSGSYTGSASNTPFGAVQVKVVVNDGKITDVVALRLTNSDGRSQQISNYAAPILRKEVLAAQSAAVSSVGGATYTSEGYLSSLQSALNQAGL